MVGLNENKSMMTNMINYSYIMSSKNNRSYFHAIIDSGKNPSFEPFHFIWKFCVLVELKFLQRKIGRSQASRQNDRKKKREEDVAGSAIGEFN